MLEIINGNILDSRHKYIAHQTNCITQRSAHLAKSIFDKYPFADIYSERAKGIRDEPGTIVIRGNGKNKRFVINMLAQVYPGRVKFPNSTLDGFKAREIYFNRCLQHIAKIDNLDSVAFPYGIGCGAAGGNWNKYFKMLEEFADQVSEVARVSIYKL